MKAEAVSYGTWSLGFHKRARGVRLPINATIELTHRCPLACAHCYNNLPVGDRAARARELSTDEHQRILDELADAGGLWLLFTGGEIFARADFLDIYKHAKSRGFLITLFTNGTQITPGHRRHAGRMAAVRRRDHPLRPHARDLRTADRRPRLVRSLHARDSACSRSAGCR